jgi:hypothetical protein
VENDITLEICGWRLYSIINPPLPINIKVIAITMHSTKAYKGTEV